jgi:hypothetical protein
MVSCGEPQAPPGIEEAEGSSEPRARQSKPAVESLEAERIEQLSAIGYVSGSTPAGPLKGVTTYDAERAHRGFNFFTSGHAPVAILMDMEGNVLHEWQADFDDLFPRHPRAPGGVSSKRNFWRHAQLLQNGDVIGIWNTFGIFRLDKHSKILWARTSRAHHDLDLTEDGEIYHLDFTRRFVPEIKGGKSVEDFIVVFDENGVELRRLSLLKALENASWPELRRAFWLRERVRKHGMGPDAKNDPLHTNALWILSKQEAERLGDPFRAGNVLVSMCLLDTIAAIDMSGGFARWWQTGPFGLQHQPRVTPDGRIVVFNNHLTRESSSVQIIDPHTREVTWEYRGPASNPLFSRTSAGVEVLPNGNVFIVETNKGRVLEVTPGKEIVWEFHSPYRTGEDDTLVASIFHMDRVEASLVKWLDR